jgi:epoxide hydrolase 4
MRQAHWEEKQIITNGVQLHVIQAGPTDGPLVILLHGFPEWWYGWRHQIQPLANAGFRVWIPDQRGYNLSAKPGGIQAYRIDTLAQDVLGLIDAAHREQAALVGHDWGAAVAWWTALRSPERIHRLAILNVPHPVAMQHYLRTHLSQLRKSWYICFFQLPYIPEMALRRNQWQIGITALIRSSQPGTFSNADLDQYRIAWSQPGAMTSMLNWYRALIQHPPRVPDDIRIHIPTKIIWGKQDRFLDAELARESLAFCDQGSLTMIDDATHWVQHERPEQVNDLLINFLSSSSKDAEQK